MYFYRSQGFQLEIKKSSGITRAFFLSIKLTFRGEVDSSSGMIINLSDVDQYMVRALKTPSSFANIEKALEHYWNYFYKLWPELLFSVEIFSSKRGMIRSRRGISRWLEVELDYQESKKLVRRKTRAEFVGVSFRQALEILKSQKEKSSTKIRTAFVRVLIQHPEWKGWEISTITSLS